MKRIKKRYLLSAALVLMGGIFFVMFFLPKFLSTENIRGIVQKEVSKLADIEMVFDTFEFSFFPRPRLIFSNVDFSIPKGLSGRIEKIEIGPDLSAFLKGKFNVGRLAITQPTIQMDIKDLLKKEAPQSEDAFFLKIKKSLEHARKIAEKFNSDLKYVITGGTLDFMEESRYFFKFHDLNAQIIVADGKCDIEAECQSNIWNHIDFTSTLDLKTFSSSGFLKFDRLRPQLITSAFYKLTDLQIGDNSIPLSIYFDTSGFESAFAKVESEIPSIILFQDNQKITIEGGELKGVINARSDNIELVLENLHLAYPEMDLSGKLILGPTLSNVDIELHGKDIDIDSTENVTLAVMGKNKIVQVIFDILNQGTVSDITFKSHGNSFKEILKRENFFISGEIRDSNIFIPGVDLNIYDTTGKIKISNGVLTGTDIKTHIGDTVGTSDKLTVGLYKNDPRLGLDLMLDADLSDLPPVLAHLMGEGDFTREINQITEVRGRAKGRLVLSGDLNNVSVEVDVSNILVEELMYERIPFPMKINKGTFRYQENQIDVGSISGSIGETIFSDLSFSVLDWKNTLEFSVISKEADVKLGDFYPWMQSFENIENVFKDLELNFLKGDISLQTLDIKGPVLDPEKWIFHAVGIPENLVIDSGLLAGVTTVDKGVIEADQNHLKVTSSNVTSEDTSLTLSGIFYEYLEGVDKFLMDLDGSIDNKNLAWIYDITEMPDEFKIKGPCQITNGSVSWSEEGPFSVSGDAVIQNGPFLFMDVEGNKENLFVKFLKIKDSASDAVIVYEETPKRLDMLFSGDLNKETVDSVLMNNTYFEGFIKGNMEASFDKTSPGASESSGMLYGEKFTFPWSSPVIYLPQFHLSSTDKGICIDNTTVNVFNTSCELQGNINFQQENFYADLDAFIKDIQYEKLKEEVSKDEKGEADRVPYEENASWPVSGKINVSADSFQYKKSTFSSVNADILYSKDKTRIQINRALCCGISVPGTFDIYPEDLYLTVYPVAIGRDLTETLDCFTDIKSFIKGKYTFNGEVYARGKKAIFPEMVEGEFRFDAEEGRIYRFVVLAKIFALINLRNIIRGELPNLIQEGFPYKAIRIDGNLRGDRLYVKGIVDNDSMGISCTGFINVDDETLDFKVLVSPFKTVDFVINHLPVVKRAFNGKLISIPVMVKGSLKDPKIAVLDPEFVDDEMIDFLERTLDFIRPPMEENKKPE